MKLRAASIPQITAKLSSSNPLFSLVSSPCLPPRPATKISCKTDEKNMQFSAFHKQHKTTLKSFFGASVNKETTNTDFYCCSAAICIESFPSCLFGVCKSTTLGLKSGKTNRLY
jgi:hypothetical protein